MTDADLARLAARSYSAVPTWQSGDARAVRSGFVITVPGTDPARLEDWLTDLDAIPDHDRVLGICHYGFLLRARALLPLILRDMDPREPLTLAGHSMGGAVAVLLAADLLALGRPVSTVVTFGAPRAGGWWVRWLLRGVSVRQYRCGRDPVTSAVPRLWGLFWHARRPIAIGRSEPNPLCDHAITAYAAALT